MIKELKVYFKLRPILKQLKELFKMRQSTNVTIQILALIAQGLAVTSELFPPEIRIWVPVIVSTLQSVVGVLAHRYNPDGTSAEFPYGLGSRKK